MDFLQHTFNWVKGEIFEQAMIGLFGVGILAVACFAWEFGQAPTARALVIPFMVVGLLCAAIGVAGSLVNNRRFDQYEAAYKQDPTAFIRAEDARVDSFMGWYRYTLGGAAVFILTGLGLFFFLGGNHSRAIGMAAILLGLAGLLIDHVSENNAKAYQAEIKRALE